MPTSPTSQVPPVNLRSYRAQLRNNLDGDLVVSFTSDLAEARLLDLLAERVAEMQR
jgi:hypothetical protein